MSGHALAMGAVIMITLGCGPETSSTDGAGGRQNSPTEECHWCADTAPFVRACATTMIASGGQLVCVDDGASHLCEPPSACRR